MPIQGTLAGVPTRGCLSRDTHPRVPRDRGCPPRGGTHTTHPGVLGVAVGAPVGWREEPVSATSPRGRSHAWSVTGQEPPAERSSQNRPTAELPVPGAAPGTAPGTAAAGAARAPGAGGTMCPGK